MDYAKISKDTMGHLYEGYKSLHESPISSELRALIELLVSRINGCEYCCNLHKNEALKLVVDENKINNLFEFNSSSLFSYAEKEVLSFAESLTKLDGNKKVQNTELLKYFLEREIVDITISIALMNAFNRLAISMRED
jgi:AhpD family alkylhydroperoxidase